MVLYLCLVLAILSECEKILKYILWMSLEEKCLVFVFID